MTDPLRTDKDYELFIYSLVEQFPSIKHSSITFVRRGISLARIAGELHSDIKHNRIPAPEMSFSKPNLIKLIKEVESLLS